MLLEKSPFSNFAASALTGGNFALQRASRHLGGDHDVLPVYGRRVLRSPRLHRLLCDCAPGFLAVGQLHFEEGDAFTAQGAARARRPSLHCSELPTVAEVKEGISMQI